MNRFRIGPKAAASGLAEKGAGFTFNALALAAGNQRQQKNEEDWKRQFTLTNKGLGGKMEVFGGKTLGNQLKKSIQNGRKLA